MKASLKTIILFVALPLFSALPFDAQSTAPHYEVPPAVAPSSCGIALVSEATIVGDIPYKRLAIQLEALRSAQNAVSAMEKGMTEFKTGPTPSLAMSSLFTGTKQAHDALLCSAYLIATYKPVDKDDATSKSALIIAYNQEAAAISDLEVHIKKKFLRSEKDQTQATVLKDAEQMTAITSLQQEAAETLLETTTYALMMSVDLSDPNAKETKQTVLSCEEFNALKAKSTAFSQETKSAYTDAASLISAFLDGHQCI